MAFSILKSTPLLSISIFIYILYCSGSAPVLPAVDSWVDAWVAGAAGVVGLEEDRGGGGALFSATTSPEDEKAVQP